METLQNVGALAAQWRTRAADLRTWAAAEGAACALEQAAHELETAAGSERTAALTVGTAPVAAADATWRERMWTVPDETRLGVREVSEALGKPRSWVYRHTSSRSGLPRIPHRKFDASLVFVAGEIRGWVRTQEEVAVRATTPRVVVLPGLRCGA